MNDLSSAAQAVLDASNLHPCKDSCLILSAAAAAIVQAFDDAYEIGAFQENWQEDCLAAALRALAARINGADAIRSNDRQRRSIL